MNDKKLQAAFQSHGFSCAFFATGAEAAAYLSETLTGRTIGIGGSVTVRQLGLYELLAQKNAVVWHHRIAGDETKRLAAQCAVYITSANAASETGELVNMDGAGNRLAMTLYGPEQVYYLIGRNKIVPDCAAAIWRAKHIAAPKNAQRTRAHTPCAERGDRCYNCDCPDRICRATLILDRAPNRTPSKILFIDEDLGF